MRRLLLFTLAFVVCGPLLTQVPIARAAYLGAGEAKAATAVALSRYYGYAWNSAPYKKIERPNCYSRSHCQTRYSFEPPEGGFCGGDVVTWRNRFGELWYHVRPNPEDRDSC